MTIRATIGAVSIGVGCVLWDISVRSFLPFSLFLEPLLSTVVILAFLQKRQASWVTALVGALALDAFQIGSWPWLTVFISVYLLILQLLTTQVLTSRSFYSAFSLLLIGRAVGWLVLWLTHESVMLWPLPLGFTPAWVGIVIPLCVDALWILLWYLVVSHRARRGPARYTQPKWFA